MSDLKFISAKEARAIEAKVERRFVQEAPAVLSREEGQQPTISGHAAVFNQEANIGGMFREVVAPGAFRDAVGRDDVRALFNHDPNQVLGRTKAGTLKLSEDSAGLRYEILPPDTQVGRDLVVSIDRGDVSQSSFGFRVVQEEWDDSDDMPLRTIMAAELFDVSPVTYPAYEGTDVGVRAEQDAAPALRVLKRRKESADKVKAEAAARARKLRLLELAR